MWWLSRIGEALLFLLAAAGLLAMFMLPEWSIKIMGGHGGGVQMRAAVALGVNDCGREGKGR